jgi:hypothetical protein
LGSEAIPACRSVPRLLEGLGKNATYSKDLWQQACVELGFPAFECERYSFVTVDDQVPGYWKKRLEAGCREYVTALRELNTFGVGVWQPKLWLLENHRFLKDCLRSANLKRALTSWRYAQHPFSTERSNANYIAALFFLGKNGILLQNLPYQYQRDRQLVMTAVKQNGLALAAVSGDLREDREVVLAAVQSNPAALASAPIVLTTDRAFVQMVIANVPAALQHATIYNSNREFVVQCVAQTPAALQYVKAEFKNDFGVVVTALAKDAKALQYASDAVRNHHAFQTAMSQVTLGAQGDVEVHRKDGRIENYSNLGILRAVARPDESTAVYIQDTNKRVVLASVTLPNGESVSLRENLQQASGKRTYTGTLLNGRTVVYSGALAVERKTEEIFRDGETHFFKGGPGKERLEFSKTPGGPRVEFTGDPPNQRKRREIEAGKHVTIIRYYNENGALEYTDKHKKEVAGEAPPLRERTYPNSKKVRTYLGLAGREYVKTKTDVDKNGNLVTAVFRPNGTLIKETKTVNGVEYENTYDDTGQRVVMRYDKKDKTYTWFEYRENGSSYVSKKKYADGMVRTFADGGSKRSDQFLDGRVVTYMDDGTTGSVDEVVDAFLCARLGGS